MSAPSLAELKAYIGATDDQHDAVLTALLAAAAAFVERETGLVFGSTAQVVHLSGGGRGTVALHFGQPVTITEVALEGASSLGAGFAVLESTEWELRDRMLIRAGLASGAHWPAGRQNIRVTYTAGYSSANPMPANLKQAILDVAATGFRNRRTERPVLQTDSQLLEVQSSIPSYTWATIRSYRMPRGF